MENFAHKSFEKLIRERLQNRVTPKGLQVLNADGDKATLRLYDEIGWFGITAEDVAQELESITAEELEVQINSLGGDVFDGIAIYNALRSHPARITVRVDSMAASIASVIAQAGDHRVMLTGSQMMIHNAWGLAIGDSKVMHETGDILEKQNKIIASIYAERASGDVGEFLTHMSDETWYDHDEALSAGLADEVVKPESRPADKSRLAAQIDSLARAADDISERVAEVAALRTDQGKSLDDSWQTREDVDQLSASLNRLVSALSPQTGEDPDGHVAPVVDASRLDALRARVEARKASLEEASQSLENLT